MFTTVHLRDQRVASSERVPRIRSFGRDLVRDWALVLMSLPAATLLIVFAYLPMYGLVIAFQDFAPGQGFFRSNNWVGLMQFRRFFASPFAWRLIRNTFLLNFYSLVFGFPIPIVFALVLNEVRSPSLKKICQTVTYLPNFISTVVIVGLVVNMMASNGGIINEIAYSITGEHIEFFLEPRYFRPIYITSGIWASFGWGSIIYLSAIAGIDPELYEFAQIDGATRLQQMYHITLPGILPTVSILFILNVAQLLTHGVEKIILLYNPLVYETADVISTYVYRAGLIGGQYSFATAIGLMNAVVSFLLLFTFNSIARKLELASLW